MTNTQPDIQLPHRRLEAWRWSDVQRAANGAQGLAMSASPGITLPDGLMVTRSPLAPKETPMSKLAARFAGEGYCIHIPAGFSSKQPIIIRHDQVGHCQIKIDIGSGAKIDVIECYESGNSGFYNTEISYELAQGARLYRIVKSEDSETASRIVTAYIHTWGACEVSQYALAFGAALSRFETRLASSGANLKAQIHGAYLLSGKRHCDMTSYLDLVGDGAHIRQSVKGVAADRSTGVFQGKFHVRRTAQLTDAEMRHDAILLSDTAHVKAKPELEIYADDVACAHGNTVGALDESALFYMRSRGIPEARAKALLTEAFVVGAFDGMAEQDANAFIGNIRDWLEVH